MKYIGTALLIGSLLLSACGTRDESDGDTPAVVFGPNGEVITGGTDAPTSIGLSVRAITNANSIETGSSEPATITALVTDRSNLAVAAEPVVFSATGGVLQNVTTETDENGEATAELRLKQSYEEQTITVTVVSGTASDQVDIRATGTSIEIVGTNSVVLGDSAELTVTLVDGKGQAIANEPIVVSSAQRNTLTSSSPVTDSDGRVTVIVNSSLGDDTITVSALNDTVMQTHQISVASDILEYVSPQQNAEFPVGTVNTIEVEWMSENVPVAGQQLRFAITAGQIISNNLVTTDSAGRATIQVSSSSAGPATISVAPEATGEPTKNLSIEFIATTPNSLSLSASATRVPTTKTSKIVALVSDVNGNPVKNQEVVFSSADLKGGQLNPASATTGSDGKASVVFTAGNLPTEFDEIELVAEVGSGITGSARLTVVEQALNVTLGTSGILDIIADEAQYGLPFAVQVADGAGRPLNGAIVEVSISPTVYYKGYYTIGVNETNNQSRWVQVVTAECTSEDSNGNRILDAGEDFNNNGDLDPQDPALVAAHLSSTPTVQGGQITTDANGSGYFTLVYPASSARWSEVDITVRANSLGVEAEETFHAILYVAADRVNDLGANPPNIASPYGTSDVCTDEL